MASVGQGAPDRRTGAHLTIGKVLEALRAEFPDVSLSKLRFLEAEGLVEPARTASGYRSYSAADVDRLRYILGAQRDRFWPLKVIRDALDAMDRGLPDPTASAVGPRALPTPPEPDPGVPTPEELRSSRRYALTAPELREAAGIDQSTLEALQRFGLVRASRTGHFDEDDLGVAAAARILAEHGLEPRHLRGFRTAADREIGLVEQVLVATRGDQREARSAEIAAACVRLHAALVKGGLTR